MFAEIVRDISDRLDLKLSLKNFHSVLGGDINAAYQLFCEASSGETQDYFVKTNTVSRFTLFEQEAKSLNEIARSNSILVPEVICFGVTRNNSYLALESLTISSSGSIEKFAHALASMHLNIGPYFGFSSDNFIGTSPQPNKLSEDWIDFYRNQRILHQIQLLESKGVGSRLMKKVSILCDRLHDYYTDYQPKASLVHGDLWSGNYSFLSNGMPVIYDPACYYGDHEVDLAMLELFGRPSSKFFAAYREIFPIDVGYSQRKNLYNLYHILNHANLFGGGYLEQAEVMIDGLLAH